MSLSIDSTIRLASGRAIPRLGYGVYKATGKECEDGVVEALRVGYRHVDSAQAYSNEQLVADGIRRTKIDRDSLFLTTKYMSTHKAHPVDDILRSLRPSLKRLDPGPRPTGEVKADAKTQGGGHGDGYIDLLLIHAPFGGSQGRANNWAALVEAQKEGWVKDIGVSNFSAAHLTELPAPIPAINQIELHPWCQQREIVKHCQEHNIVVQAYSPLVRADAKRWADPVLTKVCEKHGKNQAQVLLRWSLQKGYVPLVKSVTPSRIASNADLYDFELDKTDMEALDGLDQGAAGAATWNPVDKN